MLKLSLPLLCGLFLLAACQRTEDPTQAVPVTPHASTETQTPTDAAPSAEPMTPDEGSDTPPQSASTEAADHQAEGATRWNCNGTIVAAVFNKGSDTVTVMSEGREVTLPHAISASGARYADEQGNEFWNKGEQSMITLDGKAMGECQMTAGNADAGEARTVQQRIAEGAQAVEQKAAEGAQALEQKTAEGAQALEQKADEAARAVEDKISEETQGTEQE